MTTYYHLHYYHPDPNYLVADPTSAISGKYQSCDSNPVIPFCLGSAVSLPLYLGGCKCRNLPYILSHSFHSSLVMESYYIQNDTVTK